MPVNFKVLAYDETPLGVLCLRKRLTLSDPQCWVNEVTLDHEFLMSSLHTESERALAKFAIDRIAGEDLQILIGGLGLGYTAAAALQSPRVGEVRVIELLPQVIGWIPDRLTPLSESLDKEPRFQALQEDIYSCLRSEPEERRWDAILIDVDHSPKDQVAQKTAAFYSRSGLGSAAKHLRSGGVIGL